MSGINRNRTGGAYAKTAANDERAPWQPRWSDPRGWASRPPRHQAVAHQINDRVAETGANDHSTRLKLLTFNIQVGIKTSRYRHYVTNGWKHLWPHEERALNLRKVGDIVSDYDVVALQEIDGGSLRSGYLNQVEFLAEQAGFPYWYTQTNRALGMFAQHGNGLLSRIEPIGLEDHKMPGTLPGRGAILVRIPLTPEVDGKPGAALVLAMLHLSLGPRSREWQLHYLAERLADEQHFVVMGDLNTHMAEDVRRSPLVDLGLAVPAEPPATFPAWEPQLSLDHVLVSPHLEVERYEALPCHLSDHLPIGVTLRLTPDAHRTLGRGVAQRVDQRQADSWTR
ncbi:MAG: endonuclease/exonuclease/phosphatase family protein [Pseudomonadota bacterium]